MKHLWETRDSDSDSQLTDLYVFLKSLSRGAFYIAKLSDHLSAINMVGK